MINIFVTYRCNLACSYCFACELQKEFREDLSQERFQRLLDWITRAGMLAAAFIGGEPTLHPHLPDMVEQTAETGVAVVLFTNGLFPTELAHRLAPSVSNFVINYNEPETYTQGQWELLHRNLDTLTELGARITFSKNFSRAHSRYDYLLEALERYKIRSVRYDISRPGAEGKNDHFTLSDTREVMSRIVGFVKACERMGVGTGLDCSVRFCDMKDEDRLYLERVSAKFTGVCHPSIDIHPDLSASYCLPLNGIRVPDVTLFNDEAALRWYFAQEVRPLRLENVSASCLDCKDFMRRCQGGCLALQQAQGQTTPEPERQKDFRNE